MTAATAPSAALETVTLIHVNAAENNNKFYELSKMPDGSTFARWGRVGGGKAQTRTYPGHGSFQTKRQEKLRKGYTVFDGGHASQALASTPSGDMAKLVSAGLFRTAAARKTANDLIAHLIRSNRHAIGTATGGRITVSDSGAVSTALGAVSMAQIAQARTALATLRSGYDRRAVETYLTLIPQKIADVRATDWVTRSWCRQQDDLLDALESAVTMSAAADATGDDEDDDVPAIPFRYTLVALDEGDVEFSRIAAKFDGSRNSMHAAARLRLHRVWVLADTGAATWDERKAALKHSRELWHGTTAGNVLSILRTGLHCPSFGAGSYNTTGRMFGDGVYFSDQSTKSLNYAIGRAPGQRGGADCGNSIMFLADVVMGRECRSDASISGSELVRRSRSGADTKGRSYDSLVVRGGHCGVMNDEMVVWRTEQIKLTHLCEFR